VNSRAWVVQEVSLLTVYHMPAPILTNPSEQLLCSDVLHFSPTQLYCECNELQASELLPLGISDHPNFKGSLRPNTSLYCLPIDVSFMWDLRIKALVLCKVNQTEDFCRVGFSQHYPQGLSASFHAECCNVVCAFCIFSMDCPTKKGGHKASS
jgi:hypothetical protein